MSLMSSCGNDLSVAMLVARNIRHGSYASQPHSSHSYIVWQFARPCYSYELPSILRMVGPYSGWTKQSSQ